MNKCQILDLITIGRSSVDLYGRQVGGLLEDMGSFNKYIGGSPTNIAAGASRLGLKSALITRVGDEHFGRFVRSQLVREGVDVRYVITDAGRLTALAILGIRDENTFPLVFYRENCADMALSEDDIEPEFIAETRCLCVTGTHLSHPRTEAAVLKAIRLARANHALLALDIDYRPNLWGLAGHGEGESRFIESDIVTAKLKSHLQHFDLIVGTEEELHIAGGSTSTHTALVNIRQITDATIVCKRGALGAAVFPGSIPDLLDDGIVGDGFDVEVYNVLGAGDGFMAGLLKGWLTGEDWESTLKIANACGALAVSRHGCTPSYPSEAELEWFLANWKGQHVLRKDRMLEHVHRATNRGKHWPALRLLAFDECDQFVKFASRTRSDEDRVSRFKELCLRAVKFVAGGDDGYGVIGDDIRGRSALHMAAGIGLWIGRPVEIADTLPHALNDELGPDCGGLQEWPLEHVVKAELHYSDGDDECMWTSQMDQLKSLAAASRRSGLELMVAMTRIGENPDKRSAVDAIKRIYSEGIYPDWWMLESSTSVIHWQRVEDAIMQNDQYCRGVVIAGMDNPSKELVECFDISARYGVVKGFAVGRAVHASVARQWFRGQVTDRKAILEMASRYRSICRKWDRAAKSATGRSLTRTDADGSERASGAG